MVVRSLNHAKRHFCWGELTCMPCTYFIGFWWLKQGGKGRERKMRLGTGSVAESLRTRAWWRYVTLLTEIPAQSCTAPRDRPRLNHHPTGHDTAMEIEPRPAQAITFNKFSDCATFRPNINCHFTPNTHDRWLWILLIAHSLPLISNSSTEANQFNTFRSHEKKRLSFI